MTTSYDKCIRRSEPNLAKLDIHKLSVPVSGPKFVAKFMGVLFDTRQTALYCPKEKPPIDDLFGDQSRDELTERVNIDELQGWVTHRLNSILAYVAEPKPLTNSGRLLFLFYFAVSNKAPAAHRLADRAIRSIMQ